MCFIFSELLEGYSKCRTASEVISLQQDWLERERSKQRDRKVDYPPSSSSSEEEELCDSMREEDKGEEEKEDGQCSKVTPDSG